MTRMDRISGKFPDLLIDSDDERQGVADFDRFGDSSVDRLAGVDPHRRSGHGSRRRQRGGREGTENFVVGVFKQGILKGEVSLYC